ncbi:MAG TPA: NADH-quinone oxidoreductase subunit NuoF [Anaerolineales bacterium]|nr:NADH-quinone oxidoreductase subunit NuoF [Anaerolineales bacterium]
MNKTEIKEQRIVLKRFGQINPESIDDYINSGGYSVLKEVLGKKKPDEIIAAISESGLQGRGGAGFPTGVKWKFVAGTKGPKKYIICNADESEPGTFKDRLILEGDPHSVLEAMIIAAYTVGADEGYIYVRGEYSKVHALLKNAIEEAREKGFLGKKILDSGLNFDLHIHIGAGAYICGEETALIESIEGRRGEPRTRPPFPTTHGLWGKPTLVNNVETFANIVPIIENGPEWYRSFGTESSSGTKVFTILGNVEKKGFIEVPMGITLRQVISDFAGGMENAKPFKLAQTGGSSGSIIPEDYLDVPIDFQSFGKSGVAMGSGALLICNDETCVVELAKVLLNFFRYESCSKCNPCRIGNERAYQILDNISKGVGTRKDIGDLEDLSNWLFDTSQCGLGQTAGSPIRDILKHFRDEVEAHIIEQECSAGVCQMSKKPTPVAH